MTRFLTFILSLLLFMAGPGLNAQVDTSLHISEVLVTATSEEIHNGVGGNQTVKLSQLKSAPIGPLASLPLLRQQGFRSYGPGQVATVAFRGASAQHTALFWEGMPINSPMIGLSDLGVMMWDSYSEMQILQGVLASAGGPNSSAAAIHFRENFHDRNGLQANANMALGSYGQRTLQAGIHSVAKRFSGKLSLATASAENDYPYRYFGQTKQLENASTHTNQLKAIGQWAVRSNQLLTFGTWLSTYEREVPPTRLQSISRAVQSGESARNFLRYSVAGKNHILNSQVAFTFENFGYRDERTMVNDRNRANILFLKQSLASRIRSVQVELAWDYSLIGLHSPNYLKTESLHRAAVSGKAAWESGSTRLSLRFRQDFSQDQIGIPVVNIIHNWKITENLSWVSGVGSFFRWPSTDDLYWTPGGEPELKPEFGMNVETGMAYASAGFHENNGNRFAGSLFYRRQENTIQWYPAGSLWEVINQGPLESYGAILNAEFRKSWSRYHFKTQMDIQLVKSDRLDDNNRLQELYVPLAAGSVASSFGSSWWQLSTRFEYFSERQYLNIGAAVLPALVLNDTGLHFGPFDTGFRWTASAFVQNLLNADYEWVKDRPMPGRNFVIQLKIN